MAILLCNCGASYDVAAGERVRCKACGALIDLPPVQPPSPAPPDGSLPGKGAAAPTAPKPWEEDPSLIGAQKTVAGNPGRLDVSFVRFARCFPIFVAVGLVGMAACALAGVFVDLKCLIGIPLMAIVPFQAFEKVKQKFHAGNLCAALVVARRPYRVAVYTDLSTGRSGPRLAIGVRPQPLARMTGGPPAVGARLAAVAHYYGSVEADAWMDFAPTVINCACSDERQISRAVASIDANDWRELERVVATLPGSEPGLHRLWELPDRRFSRAGSTRLLGTLMIVAAFVVLILTLFFMAKKAP